MDKKDISQSKNLPQGLEGYDALLKDIQSMILLIYPLFHDTKSVPTGTLLIYF